MLVRSPLFAECPNGRVVLIYDPYVCYRTQFVNQLTERVKDGLDLWEGEYDANCVEQTRQKGGLPPNITVVTGDQSDPDVLHNWVKQGKHPWDIIVDDGGHTNPQIMASFLVLFERALSPGGLYFFEDLQVGRHGGYFVGTDDIPIADVVTSWMEQLSIPNPEYRPRNDYVNSMRLQTPIKKNIKWILCQSEACLIAKCDDKSLRGCSKFW